MKYSPATGPPVGPECEHCGQRHQVGHMQHHHHSMFCCHSYTHRTYVCFYCWLRWLCTCLQLLHLMPYSILLYRQVFHFKPLFWFVVVAAETCNLQNTSWSLCLLFFCSWVVLCGQNPSMTWHLSRRSCPRCLGTRPDLGRPSALRACSAWWLRYSLSVFYRRSHRLLLSWGGDHLWCSVSGVGGRSSLLHSGQSEQHDTLQYSASAAV